MLNLDTAPATPEEDAAWADLERALSDLRAGRLEPSPCWITGPSVAMRRRVGAAIGNTNTSYHGRITPSAVSINPVDHERLDFTAGGPKPDED